MINKQAQEVIDRLEGMDKQGESYTGNGRYGFRNPIKSDTGLLLHSIIAAEKPHHILELGTAYGLSGCYLASALNGGDLTTVEFDETVARVAQENFREAELPVIVLAGDVLDIIPRLKGKKFDCLFLDAEKKSYMKHFTGLREAGLLTPDCLVLADNVIDRAEEMRDFESFYINKKHLVFKTQAGLLVMKL